MDGRVLPVRTFCQRVAEVHDWTAAEKNSMRRVFEYGLKVWPSAIRCIQLCMGTLAKRAGEQGYDWVKVSNFDLELAAMADEDKYEEALAKLTTGFYALMLELWPDCDLDQFRQFVTEYSERPSRQSTPPCSQCC